ncbi:uncharacterized protein TNCV_1215751 [Trichonephila clavipes]|nr:uncharacterized protein TNCV_1215751 [Trichonephila clavipes]
MNNVACKLKALQKKLRFTVIGKDYVAKILEVEESDPGQTTETKVTLEAELKSLEEKIAILEDRLNLRRKPIRIKIKIVIIKLIIKNKIDEDFVFPKKTTKIAPPHRESPNKQYLCSLNTANADDEDVSPPKYKIKSIFMRMINSYNLILQELHRKYPTTTNTYTKGYIKSPDDHRDITNYLKEKELEHYVIEPPSTRPLKLVIKGLPDNIEPEDIKNDLISKGINVVKIAQLETFVTTPPHLST